MKKGLLIAVLVYCAYLCEFVLYNTFGPWGKPELMLLTVVFCNLYWGIRYSIWAGFVAGVLKDAFGIAPFGTYLFVYIAAAYLTTGIRNNFYQPGSRFSRAVVTFFVLVAIFIIEVVLHLRSFEVRFTEAVAYVFMPQMVTTMVAVTYVFQTLRNTAMRLKL